VIRRYRSITPTVHPSAFVDVSAQVIGDVHIGAESSVWMNVVMRGDVNQIRIGARTNIQDLTMVHVMRETNPTIIGDNVTVGHSAVLHGATVEDRCLIGMGAILLNGCRIGTGSIVAAGAVVTQGKQFPPGSVIAGVPATVVRQANDDDLLHIRGNAASYYDRLASARRVRPVVRRPLPPAGMVPGDALA
jgi:carbonic anhydrase/acetyltransferase-like protein (isoleucine patch superfamily)